MPLTRGNYLLPAGQYSYRTFTIAEHGRCLGYSSLGDQEKRQE